MSIEESIDVSDVIRNQHRLNIELRQKLAETRVKLEKARTILRKAVACLESSACLISKDELFYKEAKQLLKELEND